ncbi:MAG: hypothetical protein AAFR12_00935 [Cyanobacteria bacterium J06626_6]
MHYLKTGYSRRRWLLAVVMGCFIGSCAQSFAEQPSFQNILQPNMDLEKQVVAPSSPDRLTHPPLRQTVANQGYQFVVSAADGWETPAATGTLYESGTPLWEVELAHQYGPRFAIVSSTGQVLLIDEFINVASSRAIALYSVQGELMAQHSFDDIQQTLDLPRARLTQKATSGWWVSAPPALNEAGDIGLVQTGGTTLSIDLLTGHLSHRPTPPPLP